MPGDSASNTIVRYQWLLRLIGRYLDAHGARTVNLLEVPEGFVAAYGCEPASPDLIDTRFSHDRLQMLEERMTSEFGPDSSALPGRYEDSLRAIGYELERERAYYVLIAELEDGFLITYQYLNPSQGFMVRKHMAVVGATEQEKMLAEARARRTTGPLHRRTLRSFFK